MRVDDVEQRLSPLGFAHAQFISQLGKFGDGLVNQSVPWVQCVSWQRKASYVCAPPSSEDYDERTSRLALNHHASGNTCRTRSRLWSSAQTFCTFACTALPLSVKKKYKEQITCDEWKVHLLKKVIFFYLVFSRLLEDRRESQMDRFRLAVPCGRSWTRFPETRRCHRHFPSSRAQPTPPAAGTTCTGSKGRTNSAIRAARAQSRWSSLVSWSACRPSGRVRPAFSPCASFCLAATHRYRHPQKIQEHWRPLVECPPTIGSHLEF